MKRMIAAAACAVSVAWTAERALARHDGYQTAPQQATGAPLAELVAACAAAQRQVVSLADAINRRLEEARQSNSPQQIRAALADVQAALVEIRTRAAACSPLQTASQPADAHAGHTMPAQPNATPGTAVTQPGSPAPAPAAPAARPQQAADPHAGHATASKPAAPPFAKPAAAPRARPAATPGAPAPPKAHSPGAPEKPAGKQMDPVTGLMVDPAIAPKTTHLGQTYYFSSEASKKEFLENPAKFARKPKR